MKLNSTIYRFKADHEIIEKGDFMNSKFNNVDTSIPPIIDKGGWLKASTNAIGQIVKNYGMWIATSKKLTMSDTQLGIIITEKEPKRDAIHIAVCPMIAHENLYPGQWVKMLPQSCEYVMPCDKDEPAIGIVDPFLNAIVTKGTKFWMCLFPKTIKSLRHEWTHPELDNLPRKVAEEWLGKNVLIPANMSLQGLIELIENNESKNMGENEFYHNIDMELFNKHLSVITGKEINVEYPPFSCAC